MVAVFESEAKTPGWDERKLDWHCFYEVQVTNDSDAATGARLGEFGACGGFEQSGGTNRSAGGPDGGREAQSNRDRGHAERPRERSRDCNQ